MSKIIKIVFAIFIFSFGLLFYLPQPVSAVKNCTFTIDPNPLQQDKDINISITSTELRAGDYKLRLKSHGSIYRDVDSISKYVDIANSAFITKFQKPTGGYWMSGDYYFDFYKLRGDGSMDIPNPDCTSRVYKMDQQSAQSSCTASITTRPIDPNTEPNLHIEGISPGDYDVLVNNQKMTTFNIRNRGDNKDTLLCTDDDRHNHPEKCKFDVGFYVVNIMNQCGSAGYACWGNPARQQCNPVTFLVGAMGSGEGGQIEPGNGTISRFCLMNPTDDKCKCLLTTTRTGCASGGGDTCSSGNNPGIKTAIGCIHTNPTELVKDLMKFAVGIGGGLAFLMMLLGAFQMLTSAGNPETLNAGKERLTAAMIGLLFVIFAVLLLQIIGVDILQIPGFGK